MFKNFNRSLCLLLFFPIFLPGYNQVPSNLELNQLDKETVEKFTVINGSADEKLFRRSINQDVKKNPKPWKAIGNYSEIRKIINSEDRPQI